jgi:hypothetical protein
LTAATSHIRCKENKRNRSGEYILAIHAKKTDWNKKNHPISSPKHPLHSPPPSPSSSPSYSWARLERSAQCGQEEKLVKTLNSQPFPAAGVLRFSTMRSCEQRYNPAHRCPRLRIVEKLNTPAAGNGWRSQSSRTPLLDRIAQAPSAPVRMMGGNPHLCWTSFEASSGRYILIMVSRSTVWGEWFHIHLYGQKACCEKVEWKWKRVRYLTSTRPLTWIL